MFSTSDPKYQQCTLAGAREGAARERAAGKGVYVVGQLLVTEPRTYQVSDTKLEGEALARKLGVQTVDEAGELSWPRHPVVAWVRRWWRK